MILFTVLGVQCTAEEIEQNKYTPKIGEPGSPTRTKFDKWFKQTGGINGELKRLELDAFSDERIIELFGTCLKKYIKPELYKKIIKNAYIKRIIYKKIKDKIDVLLNEIIDKEIGKVTRLDFDLIDLAKSGYDSLPIEDLCNKDRDKHIADLAISYFK